MSPGKPARPTADARPLFEQDPTGRFRDRAADYARARPSYPAAAIDAVLVGLGTVERAADVGAGTGISARLLAERGVRVTAVEPNAAMRAAAEPHPGVTFVAGTAEQTGLESGGVRLVLCAQAFHWFRPGEALPELARILAPGGRLALLWNTREGVDDPATAAYGRLLTRASGGHPAEKAYADPRPLLRAAGWHRLARWEGPNVQHLDREGLLRRALSASYVPREGPEFTALQAGLGALFERFADPAGRLTLRYRTVLVSAERPSRPAPRPDPGPGTGASRARASPPARRPI